MWTVLTRTWLEIDGVLEALRERAAVLERGSSAVEYAILVSVIGLAIAAAATAFGAMLTHVFQNMTSKLSGIG